MNKNWGNFRKFFYNILFLFLLNAGSFQLQAIAPADEPVVQVVSKVKPTVVNIFTERMVQMEVRDSVDEFYENFFGGGFSRGNRIIRKPVKNLGSGLLVGANGYIVTNHHVVERASDLKIKVTLDDGKEYEAKLLRDDPDLDLSLIKIERPQPFPYNDLAHISPNLLGETVIAIGNPVGYQSSVSQGILSAKDRSITVNNMTIDGLLQTDAAINPGNSGGPLVDINGNLVGINNAKMDVAQNIKVENIGFAIPADRVKTFVENAIAITEGRKPAPPEVSLKDVLANRFGIHVENLTQELASTRGYIESQGLLITEVNKPSEAAEIGVEKNMLIIGVGTTRTREIEDLPRELAHVKKDDPVRLTVLMQVRRGNTLIQRAVPVVLKAR